MIAGFIAWLARLISGVSARFAVVPTPGKRRIYFANHTSHLDAVVLWASLPDDVRKETRPVAALDYWGKGFRRWLAINVFAAVLVDRSGKSEDPLAPVQTALTEGASLIFFPEGTRGTGEALQPFKRGIYKLHAAHPEVELVPVWLENLNRVWPKGELMPIPLLSRALFGAPMSRVECEECDAFLERAKGALGELGANE